MRVAVYNLYWTTLGGGEQVAAAFAEHMVAAGHDVTLLGPDDVDHQIVKRRLGRDLSGCSWMRVTDDLEASAASESADLFINCTYLSSAIPKSPLSIYYVHFPGVPPTPRQRLLASGANLGHRLLDASGRLPAPVAGVRDGLARRRRDLSWVGMYSRIAANSEFTARWVERLWGTAAEILYPPVSPSARTDQDGTAVLSIGRFFDRSFGHCKKQDVLVDAWSEWESSGGPPSGWRLRLLGGADAASRDYVLDLRRRTIETRASVEVNVERQVITDALATSAIFWHAGGFGEDPDRHPDRFEHFGIAVVEAMAAGCVPVVYGAAGPAEIVSDGVDGFHWTTVPGLITATRRLIDEPELRARMSAAAIARAGEFSFAAFGQRLKSMIDRLAVENGQSPL
jgi:glycosyltransferase involved in cell wall biosynthesis